MTESLCIWVLLTDTQIADKMVLQCDADYSKLSEQGTFYLTGHIIGSKHLVGVQLEPDVVEGFIGMTSAVSIEGAISELVESGCFPSYVCKHDEQNILIALYPELGGTYVDDNGHVIKKFSGWSGVMNVSRET